MFQKQRGRSPVARYELTLAPRCAACRGCAALLLTPCRGIACRLLRLLGRLLRLTPNGRTIASRGGGLLRLLRRLTAPSRAVAGLLRLRCGLLGLLTPCGPALRLLGLLRGLLRLAEALRLGLLLALTCLAGFVAVNVENALDFGITLLPRFVALLEIDFNDKRDIVQLLRILHIEDADNMADGGKLTMRDFDRLLVLMVQVQTVSADAASGRAVNNLQVQLKITAVVLRIRLDFRRFDNNGMLADRKTANALGRVVLLRVERLQKLCHFDSPFRKVPTI